MDEQNRRLRVGLIGAGIFAREAHLPALLKAGAQYEVAAVCSRRLTQAQEVAALVPGGTEAMDDVDALLARPDIEVVDIVLPIDVQPALVEKALAAGKHVISEKPIAPTVAAARAVIRSWLPTGLCWMVAENWRYEDAFVQAALSISMGEIGRPLLASWALHLPTNASVKYFHTPWRRRGDIPGGFLVDGGVHHVAALRALLGEVESVSACVEQFSADLPPADSLVASLRFVSGALATYAVTYATGAAWNPPLVVAGTEGSLRVDRGVLEVESGGVVTTRAAALRNGIEGELFAFHRWVTAGDGCLNTPQQALRDLAVVEAMLESAARGVQVAVVTK